LIRETLRGFHQDHDDLNNEVMYCFFAHYFHWTPEQVDRIPYDRMVYILELEKEFQKTDDRRLENAFARVLSKLFK